MASAWRLHGLGVAPVLVAHGLGVALVLVAHGFGVSLVLLLGASLARALHGPDADRHDGDLAETDRESGGDLSPGSAQGGFADGEGGELVLGHDVSPGDGGDSVEGIRAATPR